MKAKTLLIAIGLTLFGMLVLSSRQGVVRAAGVAVAITPTATPVITNGVITYTIQLGDTWVTISKKFGVNAGRLLDLNNLRTRPDTIFVGEVIRIPIGLGFTPSLINPFLYTVQLDDTVESVAAKFYMDRTALREANRLKTTARLTPGQIILIPAGPHRYVVHAGDTIQSIAAMFNTTISRLLQFNSHLGDGGRIFPGNNVFVPIVYDVATFVPAPGFTAPVATTTTGEGIGGGGEGIGGGGEGASSGFDLNNNSVIAANASTITALEFITMPGNVVDLGKDLQVRWVSVNYTKRDPAKAGFGIGTLVVEFKGGNGTYRMQEFSDNGSLQPLSIRGIYVKPYPNNELWNNIEFEVKDECGSTVQGDVVLTSSGISLTSRYEFSMDCK